MRIDRLTLTNFRLFEQLEVELNPHFNVIIGGNGKGKTAICDAVAVALGGFLAGVDGAASRKILKVEKRKRFIKGGWEESIPCKVKSEGEFYGQTVGWYRSIEKRKTGSNTSTGLKAIKPIAGDAANRSLEDNPAILPVFAYHGTGRLWSEKYRKSKKDTSRFDGYVNCLAPKSSMRNIKVWWEELEGSVVDKELSDKQLWAVREAVELCIPYRSMQYDKRRKDLVGMLEEDGTERLLLFDMLSDGQRNMIGMVADIAYRAAQLNPQLGEHAAKETPGVVIIDELELHLHPNWQRQVVQNLKKAFPKVQFIATTHTPFIIQSLLPNEMLDLDSIAEGPDGVPLLVADGIDHTKESVEDVSEKHMDVPLPQRSERFMQMVEAAEEYYALVEKAAESSNGEVEKAKERLDELLMPFSQDAAFTARMERKRFSKLGE